MRFSTAMNLSWKKVLSEAGVLSFLLAGTALFCARAQPLEAIACTPIPEPAGVSVDRSGNVYLADRRGNVILYNSNGIETLVFSPPRPAVISNLEAWHGLRIFCFFRDLQEYTFLNRFLISPGNYSFGAGIVFAEAAGPSFDNNLWVFDQGDFSLKKYNVNLKEIQSLTPLILLLDQDNYDIAFIREHQNRVYLDDRRSGILVFDNLGTYINTLPLPEIDYFNFWEDRLYFLQSEMLISISLYGPERLERALPEGGNWKFALYAGDQYFLFSDKQLCRCK